MVNLSDTAKYLSKVFPGIAFSKEAVEKLVTSDKISYESAASIVADIDIANSTGAASSESTTVNQIDVKQETEKLISEKALDHYFKDVKLGAMIEGIKKDDTMLYTEFVNIDKARERIMSEIVKKEEGNFDTLLNELKTATGTPNDLYDKLLGTAVCVLDYRSRL